MFAIDLSTIVDIATVGSILILAYQVGMERKADWRNAEEEMRADRRYAEERKGGRGASQEPNSPSLHHLVLLQ